MDEYIMTNLGIIASPIYIYIFPYVKEGVRRKNSSIAICITVDRDLIYTKHNG
jgi:hypothetical protein